MPRYCEPQHRRLHLSAASLRQVNSYRLRTRRQMCCTHCQRSMVVLRRRHQTLGPRKNWQWSNLLQGEVHACA